MIKQNRLKRKRRIRASVRGTSARPRLSVYRSNKYVYCQIIDDSKSVTLVGVKGSDPKILGKEIAERAKKKKISEIVFDRSGYRYHGKVKAIADAAREGGLKF